MTALVELLRVCADHAASNADRHWLSEPADKHVWADTMSRAADCIESLQVSLYAKNRDGDPTYTDDHEAKLVDLGFTRAARQAMKFPPLEWDETR